MEQPEQTLAIIKPDAVKRNMIGIIIKMAEDYGFYIVGMKMVHLNKGQTEEFYEIHRGKQFFERLTAFMSSGPCVFIVLTDMLNDGAVAWWRRIVGATDPKEAKSGTIRRSFYVPGAPLHENLVHGSDSVENAKIEIEFFKNL